jgi:hypothetical protein
MLEVVRNGATATVLENLEIDNLGRKAPSRAMT